MERKRFSTDHTERTVTPFTESHNRNNDLERKRTQGAKRKKQNFKTVYTVN